MVNLNVNVHILAVKAFFDTQASRSRNEIGGLDTRRSRRRWPAPVGVRSLPDVMACELPVGSL